MYIIYALVWVGKLVKNNHFSLIWLTGTYDFQYVSESTIKIWLST